MLFENKVLKELEEDLKFLLKWLLLSLVLGSGCGLVGAAFHHAIDFAVKLREIYPVIIYCMPIGGLLIVLLYRFVGFEKEPGTNTILDSIRQKETVPSLLAPAIFLATVITQLVGGSSGREGAALQIGGSIATTLSRIIKANTKDTSILVMCGMSAVFSALFGTPLTATIFSMEVVSVGVFYYSAFVPCLCSSLVAFFVAQLFNCHRVAYELNVVMNIDLLSFIRLLGLILCVALVSIGFVLIMHTSHRIFEKNFRNPYIRVVVGSVLILVLVQMFGKDYLGAGMEFVDQAIYETVRPYDFLLKAIFTGITIGCGFKGGEIV